MKLLQRVLDAMLHRHPVERDEKAARIDELEAEAKYAVDKGERVLAVALQARRDRLASYGRVRFGGR